MRNRREFLELVLGSAAVAAMPSVARAQSGASSLSVTPLGKSVHLISGAGGNIVLVTASDGGVMINGGQVDRAGDVMSMVAEQSGGPRVVALFNTDWCPHHTGANEAAAKSGAAIVAHEHTKQYLSHDLFVDWQARTFKAKPAHARPTKTFYTKHTMAVGGERLECSHLGQAHTDGDISVFCQTSNVLVAGDVLSVGKYPIADYTTGGWLGGLVTATKTLLDVSNADTRVIPGTGPVQSRADLQAQYDMLNTMRDRFAKLMRQGMSAKDMLAAGATKDFDEKWGDPKEFVEVSYKGLWLHVRELGGIV